MHCTAAICPSPHVVSYLCIDASISRISHRSGGDIGGGNQEVIGVESSEGLGARAHGTSYARHGVARVCYFLLPRAARAAGFESVHSESWLQWQQTAASAHTAHELWGDNMRPNMGCAYIVVIVLASEAEDLIGNCNAESMLFRLLA